MTMFLIGLFVGSAIGIIVGRLMAASSRGDECAECRKVGDVRRAG
jgi:hypothetical protein